MATLIVAPGAALPRAAPIVAQGASAERHVFVSLPVVATGLLAWRWQLEGQQLRGTLLQHLVLGMVSSTLIWLVWWLHFHARRQSRVPTRYRLPLEAVTAALLAATAHLGGFLSGVNTPV